MADDNNIKHAFWRDDDHNNMMHGDADADNTHNNIILLTGGYPSRMLRASYKLAEVSSQKYLRKFLCERPSPITKCVHP